MSVMVVDSKAVNEAVALRFPHVIRHWLDARTTQLSILSPATSAASKVNKNHMTESR